MATPTPATCQSQFEQGVAIALHLWPALSLAVQNNWGGPDSADKRDWFAGAVVDLFPDLNKVLAPQSQQKQETTTQKSGGDDHEEATEEPDQLDIETVLLQVMLDEFEVNVDDDSAFEVAEQILRVRLGCLKGKFDEVDALRRRFEGKGGKNVVFKKAEDQDNDTDWDTDDDEADSDEEMGEAPALVPTQPKKVEPEVDEDGFTKVVGKKRR
ncbi:rRNA accumulation- protein [Neurospora sp. IMI 360204]|nr:rRNA accumulation- protein [Neurospora sp. IMI 360204]